jgi:hypothetical protein
VGLGIFGVEEVIPKIGCEWFLGLAMIFSFFFLDCIGDS